MRSTEPTATNNKVIVEYLFNIIECFLFVALAEIISIKDVRGAKCYYVHYVDCKYENVLKFLLARILVILTTTQNQPINGIVIWPNTSH